MKLIQRMFIKQLLAVFISCVVAVVFYIVALSILVNANQTKNELHTESIDETITRIQQYKQIEQRLITTSKDQFDLQLMRAIDANLQLVQSYLIIVGEKDILYNSERLEGMSKDYFLTTIKQKNNELTVGKTKYELYRTELSEQALSVYFLFEATERLTASNIAFFIAAGVFFITYIICCFIIVYRLNKKLMKPIMKLKEAAIKISEGELNSIISLDTQDELEDLAKSLEFLRLKLKESIHLQKKYDDNRSFLISSISHDLRTPVTTIKGYVEALRDGIATTPEKEKQYLFIIDKKANQINEMIEDLLLYSKLDLNQLPFVFTKVNIINYLLDGIEEYSHLFTQQHITFSFNNLLSQPYSVTIDLNRFMRVIQNIWNNAIHYNDKQDKEIMMTVRETFTSIVIEIRDNGKGLEKGEARKIFDRFYRSDRARQSDKGSGLGLAIAKHIVEAHQGQIWAKGEIGVGTSIFISLPKIKE